MKFKATIQELSQIIANAYNASTPVGMGFLQADNDLANAEDCERLATECDNNDLLALDYVKGRMIKICIEKRDGFWIVPEYAPRADYQSWSWKYPTYKDLVESVIKLEPLSDVPDAD